MNQNVSLNSETLRQLLGDNYQEAMTKVIAIAEEDNVKAMVAEGDEVQGNLRLKHGARIAGVVRGDVIALGGTIVVEATGAIHGNVFSSRRVICLGAIGPEHGKDTKIEVSCPGLVIVAQDGVIEANIAYGGLVCYDNAMTKGDYAAFNAAKHGIAQSVAPATTRPLGVATSVLNAQSAVASTLRPAVRHADGHTLTPSPVVFGDPNLSARAA